MPMAAQPRNQKPKGILTMIVDSHMHVWSMDDVDYYDDKTIY